MKEIIRATGHENVTATHGSTVEVTTDDWLTPSGDCIIGIEADKAPRDFSTDFIERCRDVKRKIEIALECGGVRETIVAEGHPDLTFESDRSHVIRKSTYIDDRTIAVNASASAADLSRTLISNLSNGEDLQVSLRPAVQRD
ncbi:MAG: DUF371 domain-containing protein [Halobacteriaceae archaeon]